MHNDIFIFGQRRTISATDHPNYVFDDSRRPRLLRRGYKVCHRCEYAPIIVDPFADAFEWIMANVRHDWTMGRSNARDFWFADKGEAAVFRLFFGQEG
jgi:hypothetical protein